MWLLLLVFELVVGSLFIHLMIFWLETGLKNEEKRSLHKKSIKSKQVCKVKKIKVDNDEVRADKYVYMGMVSILGGHL